MLRVGAWVFGLALVGCGNGLAGHPDGSPAGHVGSGGAAGGATGGAREAGTDGRVVDAAAGDATTLDASARSDAAHDGPPTADDLQGGWYANSQPNDAGFSTTRRRRFAGGAFFQTTIDFISICGESGSFEVASDGVHFTPTQVVGTGCTLGTARVEAIAWGPDGISFGPSGATTLYRPIRVVPKLFPTPETHAGNFAGDASLAGTTAIAKADALCNSSIGRPDQQAYKALIVDGVSRSAVPPIDWVLRPNKTYFRPDGVLNVFRTDPNGLANPTTNNDVEPNGMFYVWTGLAFDFTLDGSSCRSWSSASSGDLGRVASPDGPMWTFTSSVGDPCNALNPIWCVSQ